MHAPQYDLHIIGTTPRPLGGVADFIHRLVCALDGRKILIRDIYAGEKLPLPDHVAHDILGGGKPALLRLWARCLRGGPVAPVTFVNFSNPAGLLRILPIPKSGRWVLMMHDGGLGPRYAAHNRTIRGLIAGQLRRFDAILCISKAQLQFYRECGVGEDRLLPVHSYVRPPNWRALQNIRREHARAARDGTLTVVTSGSALPEYRLDYVLKLASRCAEPGIQFVVFIYGERDAAHFEQLSRMAAGLANVRLVTDCDSAEFNDALARSDVYLRPFNRDSFGIVVADAWNLGLKVVASDCCERFGEPTLFKTDDYDAFEAASTAVIAQAQAETPRAGESGTWVDEKDRLEQFLFGRGRAAGVSGP